MNKEELFNERLDAAYTKLLSRVFSEVHRVLLEKRPMIFVPGKSICCDQALEFTEDRVLTITITMKPED